MFKVRLLDLPAELIEQCIQRCSHSSLLALCRTSRLLYSLSMRSLYSDISITSARAMALCCRTLAAKPVVVRSFSIHYPSHITLLPSFYQLVQQAFRAIAELRILRIQAPDPRLLGVLDQCTFPTLEDFQCQFTLSSPLARFLNRHTRLRSVDVSPFENTLLFKDQGSMTIDVPTLEYLTGNAQVVAKLGARVRLRAASVSWDAMDALPQLAIRQLQSDHLRVLRCRRRGWNIDLLDLVSSSLPSIYELTVANVLVVDSRPTKEYLESVGEYLSRFRHIRRLSIHCVDAWHMGDIQCNLDEDFHTVTAWGRKSSSLTQVILPHSSMMRWHRATDDIWLPDPSNDCGAVWLYETVMSGRYPAWSRLIDFLRHGLTAGSSRGNLRSFEPLLTTLRDLPHASVASIVTSRHPTTGEPRRMRWAISSRLMAMEPNTAELGGEMYGDGLQVLSSRQPVASAGGVANSSGQRLQASLRDWKIGKGHQAFLEAYALVVRAEHEVLEV